MVARLEAVLSAYKLNAAWLNAQHGVEWKPIPGMPGFEEAALTDEFVRIFSSTEISSILQDVNLANLRLVKFPSLSCSPLIIDRLQQVHFPIVTDPGCFFIFRTESPVHLAAVGRWRLDTTQAHSIMNSSAHSVVHLVGDVQEN